MQFVLMPGRSRTDTSFIVRQLREEFYAINKTLYMAFVDLEKFRSCTQTCHLVGSLQALHWGVVGMANREHVWKYQKQNACWMQPEWKVQCENMCSPRLLPEPSTVHHSSGNPFAKVSYRIPLGKPVRRLPGHHHWLTDFPRSISWIPAGGVHTTFDDVRQQHPDHQWGHPTVRWVSWDHRLKSSQIYHILTKLHRDFNSISY